MQFFYPDPNLLNLPAGHRFPTSKYQLLKNKLLKEDILSSEQLAASSPVTDENLLRAHAADYVTAIDCGSISSRDMRRIGFPWSPQIPLRARATVGGAIASAKSAMESGLSGQLAGGTHHAHYDFGAGYCVFNDFAVSALYLLHHKIANRVAVVDLDVHQGDGNAAILSPREDVFVFSVHGEKNFPFRKHESDLDIDLPDGTEDSVYLKAVSKGLEAVWAFQPDIILYQAGVDPLREDRLGRMSLSAEGLAARDRLVLTEAKKRGVPIAMAIGGGYAEPIDISVAAYANTYRIAKEVWRF